MSVDEEWDKSGGIRAPEPASSPEPPLDSSLLLLAKDLMPPSQTVEPPAVPANLDRHVRALPIWTRAWRWSRAQAVNVAHKLRLDRLAPRQRWIAGGVAGAVLIAIVAAFASSGGSASASASASASDGLAQRARDLVAKARYSDGLATYEALLMRHPRAAADRDLIADLGRVADAADPATSATALDILALQTGAPGTEEVLARTASKSAAVRHHAFALAEREGLGGRFDRVASWMLDLEQAGDCGERRAIVSKIAATHDKRLASAQHEVSRAGCDPPPESRPASRKPATKSSSSSSSSHRPKPHW